MTSRMAAFRRGACALALIFTPSLLAAQVVDTTETPDAPTAPEAPAAVEAPAAAEAPTPVDSPAKLPAATEVTQRYVQAIGGRDAILSHNSTRTTGHFEMPAAGLKGEMEILTAKPNKMRSRVVIPGMGEVRNGFDGTIGWSIDPMSGARLMQGKELEALREETDVAASLRDPSHFQSMETVEQTEMGGVPCYKVKLVWKSGRETHDCYAVDTGLLVATISTQESPMGAIQVTTLLSDYKEFDDVKLATRMTQQMMGQQQIITVENVEHGVVEPNAFEPPAEIQALLPAGAPSAN